MYVEAQVCCQIGNNDGYEKDGMIQKQQPEGTKSFVGTTRSIQKEGKSKSYWDVIVWCWSPRDTQSSFFSNRDQVISSAYWCCFVDLHYSNNSTSRNLRERDHRIAEWLRLNGILKTA